MKTKVLLTIVAVSFFGLSAHAKPKKKIVHHKIKHHHARVLHHRKAFRKVAQNIEMWCGAPDGHDRRDFPYLAAISASHGGETVTIYKKGHIVFSHFVYRNSSKSGLAFLSPDDDFSLKLPSNSSNYNLNAGFRAVIHDEDGTKLIAYGGLPCHKQS